MCGRGTMLRSGRGIGECAEPYRVRLFVAVSVHFSDMGGVILKAVEEFQARGTIGTYQ